MIRCQHHVGVEPASARRVVGGDADGEGVELNDGLRCRHLNTDASLGINPSCSRGQLVNREVQEPLARLDSLQLLSYKNAVCPHEM
jgi:hypothetical protein